MKIITVGNTKGGVGKTTVATNIAAEAARRKKRVLLIDTDPQESAVDFRGMRQDDDIMAMAIKTPTLHKDLPRMEGYDLIVIDSGGRFTKGLTQDPVSAIFRSALVASDLLVIPVQPGMYDAWAIHDTIALLKEARVYKDDLAARILLNRHNSKRLMSREMASTLAIDLDAEAPMLKATLPPAEIFAKSVIKGVGVTEALPGSTTAKAMILVYDEISQILGGI